MIIQFINNIISIQNLLKNLTKCVKNLKKVKKKRFTKIIFKNIYIYNSFSCKSNVIKGFFHFNMFFFRKQYLKFNVR